MPSFFDEMQKQFTEHCVNIDRKSPSETNAVLQENIMAQNANLKKIIQDNEAILAQINALTQQMEENLETIKGIYGKK